MQKGRSDQSLFLHFKRVLKQGNRGIPWCKYHPHTSSRSACVAENADSMHSSFSSVTQVGGDCDRY